MMVDALSREGTHKGCPTATLTLTGTGLLGATLAHHDPHTCRSRTSPKGVQACSPGCMMRVARGQVNRRETARLEAAWLEAARLDPPVHAHHSRAKGKLNGNHDVDDARCPEFPLMVVSPQAYGRR